MRDLSEGNSRWYVRAIVKDQRTKQRGKHSRTVVAPDEEQAERRFAYLVESDDLTLEQIVGVVERP